MNVHDLDGRSLAQQVEKARVSGTEGVSIFSYTRPEEGDLWGALRGWAFFLPARRFD
ncbi:MAG: hypothetical protein ACYTFG_20530 [Planctomycetota bacterium]|jgi:hypothetical protein